MYVCDAQTRHGVTRLAPLSNDDYRNGRFAQFVLQLLYEF